MIFFKWFLLTVGLVMVISAFGILCNVINEGVAGVLHKNREKAKLQELLRNNN
jgi:hypothetical protein